MYKHLYNMALNLDVAFLSSVSIYMELVFDSCIVIYLMSITRGVHLILELIHLHTTRL